ncbi:MAG TPA: hypothetical protein VFL86_27165, partial [Burkholderiaceae bacterium]|nr:hypothetical protein [Burkholderiaceae bacterium]
HLSLENVHIVHVASSTRTIKRRPAFTPYSASASPWDRRQAAKVGLGQRSGPQAEDEEEDGGVKEVVHDGPACKGR